MSTSREGQSSEQLSASEAEWKALVEEGNESFSKERYSVAEIKFKDALELAEKLLEAETGAEQEAGVSASTKAEKDTVASAKIETAKIRLTKSLNNLAALYHVQGKYGMAEALYERCLDLKLDIYGEEHLEVAVNLHNLAVLHSAKRTFAKAELLYKRSLEIREKLLGADHVDLVPILRNFALLLTKNKRQEEGVKLQERAAAIEEAHKAGSTI